MITGILLAAGAGTRFGGDKLRYPLPDGTPIGVKAARSLLSGVDHGIAVVRPDDRLLAQLLEAEGLRIAYCPDPETGMGTSLAFGISIAPNTDGWLIALGDMPFIRHDTIRSVASLLQSGAPIAAPQHQGRRGHPVGFAREFFCDLTQLGGDQGAHPLLAAHAARIHMFECEDPGIFADIDTRSDHVLTVHV
jgi:molybdenum cofactor cytidylyltransferase